MKASELIEILNNNINQHGDAEIEIIVKSGEDEERVKRFKSYEDIYVTMALVNFGVSDSINHVFTIVCTPSPTIIWNKK